MRRPAAIILGILLVTELGSTSAAYAGGGQPTSGLPAAATLFQRQQAALERVGTFHLQGTVGFAIPRTLRTTERIVADVGLRPERLRATIVARTAPMSTQAAKMPLTATVELVLLAHTFAIRVAPQQGWHCSRVPSLSQPMQSINGTMMPKTAQTVGTAYVGGQPAWSVNVMATMTVSNTPVRLAYTEFISQATDLPISERANVTEPINGQLSHVTANFQFSGFGEQFNVALPSPCPALDAVSVEIAGSRLRAR